MVSVLGVASVANGYITASAAAARGIQSRQLSEAVSRGELEKLGRGLYCTPETWEDEYVTAQHRFARGVFSHDTALYLLGLSDSAPEALTMSFPRGYNPSSAKAAGLVAKSSPGGLHGLGEVRIETPYGNTVRAYCAERTLCDMLRGTASPDMQVAVPAFKTYLSSGERNLPRLQSFADELGVGRKIMKIMEVLL